MFGLNVIGNTFSVLLEQWKSEGHYYIFTFFFVLRMFSFAIALKKPALEARYTELLKIIGDVGKDVKPAYTNSKTHSDRLRKSELECLKSLLTPLSLAHLVCSFIATRGIATNGSA